LKVNNWSSREAVIMWMGPQIEDPGDREFQIVGPECYIRILYLGFIPETQADHFSCGGWSQTRAVKG
jgi:hypothetical protein